MAPPIVEFEAGSSHQVFHGPRHQDLAGTGEAGYPRTDMDRQSGDMIPSGLHLSGVQAAADADTQRADTVGDSLGASDGSGRPVEGCEEPVASGVYLPTPPPLQLGSNGRMVPVEQIAPSRVAQGNRLPGRINDVGEEDCRQHPLGASRRRGGR